MGVPQKAPGLGSDSSSITFSVNGELYVLRPPLPRSSVPARAEDIATEDRNRRTNAGIFIGISQRRNCRSPCPTARQAPRFPREQRARFRVLRARAPAHGSKGGEPVSWRPAFGRSH